jgi:hypothetical protein
MTHITIGPAAPSNVNPSQPNLMRPSIVLNSVQIITYPIAEQCIPIVTGKCAKYIETHSPDHVKKKQNPSQNNSGNN